MCEPERHSTVEAGSKDGWNIDSIVTYVGVDRRNDDFRQLTQDINAFKWVDDKHLKGVLFSQRSDFYCRD